MRDFFLFINDIKVIMRIVQFMNLNNNITIKNFNFIGFEFSELRESGDRFLNQSTLGNHFHGCALNWERATRFFVDRSFTKSGRRKKLVFNFL